MDKSTLYRLKNGKTIKPLAPTGKTETQYPSTWFQQTPPRKPYLQLSLVTDDLAVARKMLRKSITDSDIKLDCAKTFLYLYLAEIKDTLEEDWVSYGITIGLKSAKISPLNLLELKTEIARVEYQTSDATEADDHWMAIYVASMYRIVRAKITEYRGSIMARINDQIRMSNRNAITMSELSGLYTSWENDAGYNKLIGATDMFFNRFPNNPLANIRIGTTGSRYRDCAALMSLGHILGVTGLTKATEFLRWVFIQQIGDEVDRMMHGNDELEEIYSYFPYQVDLGLVKKSSYSASSNPHFFEFVHLAGSMMRSQRSLNARHICEKQPMNILLNAGCVAYAFSRNFQIGLVYDFAMPTEESDVDDDDDGATRGTAQTILKEALTSLNPVVWIKALESTNCRMPEAVKHFIQAQGIAITAPREGTIEKHLKSLCHAL